MANPRHEGIAQPTDDGHAAVVPDGTRIEMGAAFRPDMTEVGIRKEPGFIYRHTAAGGPAGASNDKVALREAQGYERVPEEPKNKSRLPGHALMRAPAELVARREAQKESLNAARVKAARGGDALGKVAGPYATRGSEHEIDGTNQRVTREFR